MTKPVVVITGASSGIGKALAILFSHAGVSQVWLDDLGYDVNEPLEEYINNMWLYKPIAFVFNGSNPYGDDIQQTPTWIRPRSLMKANYNSTNAGLNMLLPGLKMLMRYCRS